MWVLVLAVLKYKLRKLQQKISIMEITDLQNMWVQHDKKLSENTQINKDILKNILILKTERKFNWIRVKAIFNLILPIVLLTTILIPQLSFRSDIDFLTGGLLFGIVFIVGYFWSVQYFFKVSRIDFKNTITSTKKDIIELEKYKFKITKLSYILIPFALIGMFMMAEIPLFSKNTLLPIFLIILVMVVSIYITFKFSIIEFFKGIKREIIEIEKLEE